MRVIQSLYSQKIFTCAICETGFLGKGNILLFSKITCNYLQCAASTTERFSQQRCNIPLVVAACVLLNILITTSLQLF